MFLAQPEGTTLGCTVSIKANAWPELRIFKKAWSSGIYWLFMKQVDKKLLWMLNFTLNKITAWNVTSYIMTLMLSVRYLKTEYTEYEDKLYNCRVKIFFIFKVLFVFSLALYALFHICFIMHIIHQQNSICIQSLH